MVTIIISIFILIANNRTEETACSRQLKYGRKNPCALIIMSFIIAAVDARRPSTVITAMAGAFRTPQHQPPITPPSDLARNKTWHAVYRTCIMRKPLLPSLLARRRVLRERGSTSTFCDYSRQKLCVQPTSTDSQRLKNVVSQARPTHNQKGLANNDTTIEIVNIPTPPKGDLQITTRTRGLQIATQPKRACENIVG